MFPLPRVPSWYRFFEPQPYWVLRPCAKGPPLKSSSRLAGQWTKSTWHPLGLVASPRLSMPTVGISESQTCGFPVLLVFKRSEKHRGRFR